jgi:hypothetical protein
MLQLLATTSTPLSPVKMRPAAAAMATKSEYRRMEAEEEEELDKEEWARRAEAQRRRRRSGGRYVFTCAIFASLNAILLGYGEFLQCRWRAPLPVPGDPSLRIRTAHFSCKFVRP